MKSCSKPLTEIQLTEQLEMANILIDMKDKQIKRLTAALAKSASSEMDRTRRENISQHNNLS